MPHSIPSIVQPPESLSGPESEGGVRAGNKQVDAGVIQDSKSAFERQ